MQYFFYLSTFIFIGFQIIYTIIPLFASKVKPLNIDLSEKTISVLVPAYNEELTIKNCIDAMEGLNYSNYEVIIINDGSKDQTLDKLNELLDLTISDREADGKLTYAAIKGIYHSEKYDNIYVIDKFNGGKADSLNAGIDCANSDIVITLDADSMLEINSLKYVNQYFHDDKVIALGGTVKIVQGAEKKDGVILDKFTGKGIIKSQVISYIHGFYCRKLTQSAFNSIVVISGAFGAFYKSILVDVNGFRSTVGEDIDITLKIHEYIKANNLNKKLVYAPEAVCYTECPENITNFYKQRIRWQKAYVDCILIYWSKLSRKFSFGVSIFFAIDGFVLGTLTAFTTIFYLIQACFLGTNLSQVIILMSSVLLINALQIGVSLILCKKYGSNYSLRDYIRMFVFSQFELLTYRNLLLYMNIVGTFKYFDNDEGWGFVERKGVSSIS
ncbi:glycosyltransferase family 2 protein [Paenibacillus macquariensis]|uniref:Glycosyltransferase, catalytic subunit of cellulose synthase and poly-beta-1,6-N-acetylglucosamine synthase n=1 Tax=Paenibacillus macquariensis TaxID=948756 RepID=A0ABY1K8P8_9BACL|nr:glycosyltransferase [Paenibacillus macquariensis]MEC0093316.1 glycosyltransferase [Paenibacillus macquariensis]OAB27527.1 glycosyl transferase family 2 [Paenibacillus macquariensis subsp. macquariensis]SIR41791.1 Glycosyltransferase, catalytic subunit of cellulose synthase and poly-beta-1,6-N-acetylglucosamine synthase [Paenibacillus macquariensis]